MTLPVGTTLGPYQILEPLGAGGMGEVYRARDVRLGRDVAVKVVTDRLGADGRARFEREARAASALTHPNICAVYDVGEAEGRLFLVMEIVEGSTLREYAHGRSLDVPEALTIGLQVVDALDAAHTKGIVHRDIKPGNILISSRGHVKLADFGLATQITAADDETLLRLTQSGAVVGTLHYMSPEVLRGEPADRRSDIWAFGVVLYELLAGRVPYQGASPYELGAAVLNEAAPPLPERVPAHVRDVVERCLSKDPEERYQHAAEVRAALEAAQVSAGQAETAGRRLTSTGAPASTNRDANEVFELAMNVQRVQHDIPRAQRLLERAIALDPHFAEALRYHAINHAVVILGGLALDTSALYEAEHELRQAAREDPSLVSLPSAQAAIYLMQGRRELVPIDALDRVLEKNPSHRDTILWRAILYWLDGDCRAVRELTTAILDREPLWGPPRMFLADAMRIEGDAAGAIRELEKVLEQAPGNISAVRTFAMALMDSGNLSGARDLLESKRVAFGTNYLWRLAQAVLLASEGRRDEASEVMDEETLKFAGAAFFATLDAAEYFASTGDDARAVEWLQRTIRNGDERVAWFRRNPRLASLRQDSRFQRIVESLESRRG